MKRMTWILMACLLMGSTAFAQERKEKQERRPRKADATEQAERMTERMAVELNLTDEQKTQMKTVNVNFCKQMQQLQQSRRAANQICTPDTAFFSKESRQKLEKVQQVEMRRIKDFGQAIRSSREEQMKAILTPEQFAKAQQMKAERKETKAKPGCKGDGPRKGPREAKPRHAAGTTQM